MQHHALARLAWPFAPVCPATPGSLDQSGSMQLRLRPGVAPGEVVPLAKVLVKVLHVPAPVKLAIQLQHPLQLALRNPSTRSLAQTSIAQPLSARLFVALAITSELPLR